MNVCPGCLKENHTTYCTSCKRSLFDGKTVNYILPFTKPEYQEIHFEQVKQLSISGVQTKHSLKLNNKTLELTNTSGKYILKPVTTNEFNNPDEVPLNEHLTMQIASQIFKIKTAVNGLVFFPDGEPAYITRRFDRDTDGNKILQEDFAQISGKTEENSGENYKYSSSYEDIGKLINTYVAAKIVEKEKLFNLVLFAYLTSNCDAHLKNFSLYRENNFGDYLLTPAYDLINTGLHIPKEENLALDLFADDFITNGFEYSSKYGKDDFIEFGNRLGLISSRIERILNLYSSKTSEIKDLISKSFLSDQLKEKYIKSVEMRAGRIGYSYDNDKGQE